MKTTNKLIASLFFCALLFSASKTSAQTNNLYFNQVLYLSSIVAGPVVLGTVPANKVWKIESFGGNAGANIYGRINGVDVGVLNARNTAFATLNYNSWQLPVWLPAGTTLGYTANNGVDMVWFSIIEFNVGP